MKTAKEQPQTMPDRTPTIEMLAPVREIIRACVQCGTCSGSCPNSFAMVWSPRQLWRLILLNDTTEIFQKNTFSLCSSCYSCTLRCPRGLPLTEVMNRLKQLAEQAGCIPARSSHWFHRSFLETVKAHGRIRESELMMRYLFSMKDPRLPLQFAPLGWKLLQKGKIAFEVPRAGQRRLAPLFDKAMELEQGA